MITEQTLVAIVGGIAFTEMWEVVTNQAYEDCPHEAKCFEVLGCWKIGKCRNPSIIYWTWKMLARNN